MERFIYLDNAATTAVRPEVFEKMKPFFTEEYGNPSGLCQFAQKSKKAVEHARKQIASLLGAKPSEIYFTGGGSESDNWAIRGTAEALRKKGKHIITSKIEHHAVLHTCEYLERNGFEVTYLDVDSEGRISVDQLEQEIRPDTILISIMAANNEIGTIEPLQEIGAMAAKHGILFHTDAVQAFAHIPISVDEMNIGMLSASAHKFHGPKGIGFLYIRSGFRPENLIHGGAQERNMRAGTLNVPGIVGMGEAAALAFSDLEAEMERQAKIRDAFIRRILDEIPDTVLNGPLEDRLPNNINLCFHFVEGESLLILLDRAGVCASSGSACASSSLDPSHVLLAIGVPEDVAYGSLRLSMSDETTMEQMEYTAGQIAAAVSKLRSMSPFI